MHIFTSVFAHFLTWLTYVSENMCFQLLHIVRKMFKFTKVFLAHFWHVWHICHNTCDFSFYTYACSRNMCFYGLHIIDTMCYFYMGSSHFLTCLTHVSENMRLHCHMFQKTCAFTWVLCTLLTACVTLHWFLHVLQWFSTFSEKWFYLNFVHMIDSMCSFALFFAHVVPLLMHFPDNM